MDDMKSLFRGNPHDKGIVSIDREVEDLIPGCLKNRRKDVAALRDALKQDITTRARPWAQDEGIRRRH